MKTKWSDAYLNGIRNLRRWINIYNMRLEEISQEMVSYGGGGIGEKVQTSPQGDALEKRVICAMEKYEKIQNNLLDKRLRLWQEQDIAISRIMELKDGSRKEFLMMYYIDGLNMTEIAMRLGHTEPSRIYHLKDEALDYFDKTATIKGWKNNLPT